MSFHLLRFGFLSIAIPRRKSRAEDVPNQFWYNDKQWNICEGLPLDSSWRHHRGLSGLEKFLVGVLCIFEHDIAKWDSQLVAVVEVCI
jgi:hypothetical protein